MTLEVIQQATAADITLQCLTNVIQTRSWNKLDSLPQDFKGAVSAELKIFKTVKDKLTVND